jgi:hypothetical protein
MKNKIVFILLIALMSFFLVLNNCTILSERWTITWDNISVGAAADNHLEIVNKTNETISTVKYIIGNIPPSDWNSGSSLGIIPAYSSALYSVGTSGQNITTPNVGEQVIWIKVSADAWGQSQLFAQDSFIYESGGEHKWVATIWKDTANNK